MGAFHADGIECRAQRYPSLSVVARKITGARWSGPGFRPQAAVSHIQVVCLADAEPPNVHLLRAAEEISERRAALSARQACALPAEKGQDKFYSFYRYFLLRQSLGGSSHPRAILRKQFLIIARNANNGQITPIHS